MTAARIREAAKVLRDAAESATPGPWQEYAWKHDLGSMIHNGISPEDRPEYDICVLPHTPQGSMDSYYIALMQPAVALALVDWLNVAATAWEVGLSPGVESSMQGRNASHALTLANTILGATR